MVAQVKNWSSLSEYWLGAALYGQKFLPLVGAADGSQQRCDHIPAAPACACEDRLPGRHDGARRRAEPAEAAARQAQEGARRALARRVRPSTQQKVRSVVLENVTSKHVILYLFTCLSGVCIRKEINYLSQKKIQS